MLCAVALLVACEEPPSVQELCDTNMTGRDYQPQCAIHADLQAIEKRLQPPKAPKPTPSPKCPAYDPDEVCDGECEAARGAAAEYKRKFEAMCDLATAMCLTAKSLGHWEQDDDCSHMCEFFGDGPVERGGKP